MPSNLHHAGFTLPPTIVTVKCESAFSPDALQSSFKIAQYCRRSAHVHIYSSINVAHQSLPGNTGTMTPLDSFTINKI